jgi:hypothetical protein
MASSVIVGEWNASSEEWERELIEPMPAAKILNNSRG